LTETIRKKAEEERDAMLSEARRQMAQDQADWRKQLDDETRKYTARMHGAGASALLSLTRKALSDLADETLEQRMTHHLLHKIGPMATDLKRAAGKAASAVVSSHAPLPQAAQEDLTAELETVFPGIAVRFDEDAEQSPGLVLRMGGAQLAWTVDTYIDGLDALILEKLTDGVALKAQDHDQ
jgi:F-type H+-transporting ATPase subunit b